MDFQPLHYEWRIYDMWLRSNERNVGMGQDCSLQIAVEEIGLVFYALERSIGYYFLLMETFFFYNFVKSNYINILRVCAYIINKNPCIS
jgi:hypothetical protein